jgi:hypothetical protein
MTMEIHISDWTHKFLNKTGLDAKANSELYKSKRVCSAYANPDPLVRGADPRMRIRIRTRTVPKCNGSATPTDIHTNPTDTPTDTYKSDIIRALVFYFTLGRHSLDNNNQQLERISITMSKEDINVTNCA